MEQPRWARQHAGRECGEVRLTVEALADVLLGHAAAVVRQQPVGDAPLQLLGNPARQGNEASVESGPAAATLQSATKGKAAESRLHATSHTQSI